MRKFSIHRRFSKGDGALHVVYSRSHMCRGSWRSPEAELVCLQGTGHKKYGLGNAGCRVGASRYSVSRAERQNADNGRMLVRWLQSQARTTNVGPARAQSLKRHGHRAG